MPEGYLEAQDSSDVAEASGQSQRMSLTGANRRMLHLLKRAKVQLIKIDQQKQLKMAQVIFSYQPGNYRQEKPSVMFFNIHRLAIQQIGPFYCSYCLIQINNLQSIYTQTKLKSFLRKLRLVK